MSKAKSLFVCNACGNESAKWFGCCPQCKEWNTVEEFTPSSTTAYAQTKAAASPVNLQLLVTVSKKTQERLLANIDEWDRVIGGGIMRGSFIILTGDPGIGKSTLLLHIAHELSKNHSIFYFSSEESLEQVRTRAERLGCLESKVLFSDQANLDEIIATAELKKPDLIIVDSIQNCTSANSSNLPGSVGQLKEAAFRLMRLAKERDIAVLLSGHITKEGVMAGPKLLEHMVDAVFYLQGEDRWQTRVLRSIKNRFGTVNEIGFFEMGEQGMQQVSNINAHLLDELSNSPGAVLVSSIEGSRPLLLELQALTIASQYGIPQRVVSGIDQKQVILIAAILEKYLHVKLSASDIFFKISGSLKIRGNTSDLGIALALLSSFFQQPLPAKSLAMGEISLTGQIKPINHVSMHITEAEKFGIGTLLTASTQKIEKCTCKIRRFKHVGELVTIFE
ncbi:TPA: DNA repair protein RadA [Candidatus Dependentiae bacterium]|nr:MAG: repair protein radA protein [candidate division TM6 bacterium GW2011_GWF2_43_87]HBL98057.1 DNA repair protein RadA [Candidatus Dependentiae bacterium]